MTIKKADLLYFALFIVLLSLVFREFFFTDRLFFERDTSAIEIPVRKLTIQLLKEGNLALWTDAYGNGQPFLANPKNAVFYPTTWLYLVLPLFAAFKIHYLLHIVIGWLGLYVLCRGYSLSRLASFLGATLFAFSGMYLSSFEFYSHIAALAWMPWVLWLLRRDAKPNWIRTIPIVLAWTLMILAGAPEFILMTLILASGQAFFEPGEWRKRAAHIIISLSLAALVTAAQLIPSFELLSRTERSSQSGQWPLELVQLFNLPLPHFLGDDRTPGHNDFWGWHLFDKEFPLYYSLYIGVGALLLVLAGSMASRVRREKILLALLFLFFLLACGRYSPFFVLYKFVPVLSSIRFPIKFFLGSIFCLSILAAFGFDRIMTEVRPEQKGLPATALTAGAGLLLFGLFRKPVLDTLNQLFIIERETSLRELGRSIETGLVLLAVYSLVLHFVRRAKQSNRVLGWALVTLAILDPAYHNQYINPTVAPSFYQTALAAQLPGPPVSIYRDETVPPFTKATMADDQRLFRFFRESFYPFTGLGEGVRYVFNSDFYGTYPTRDLEVLTAVRRLPPRSQFKVLNYVGCAALISYQPLFSVENALRLETEGPDTWLERIAERNASPFVAFRTIKAIRLQDKLNTFIGEGFDPYRNVIVEGDALRPGLVGDVSGLAGKVRIRKEIQGRGWYTAVLPRDGIVVIPGHNAPGWRAWVDGRRAEIFEANIFSKGIAVPAGRHEVVVRYLPASFVWGAVISIVSLGLGLFGLALATSRHRRKGRRGGS